MLLLPLMLQCLPVQWRQRGGTEGQRRGRPQGQLLLQSLED